MQHAAPATTLPIVGLGNYTYAADAQWLRQPEGCSWTEVPAVAVDSRDQVYVFNRGDHPLLIYAADGTFLRSWDTHVFQRAHGITIGPDDAVYCTDDLDHTVRKFSPNGELLLTLGTSGQPSDTGATSIDYRTIRHAGPPFYFPTNVALAADGTIYVADGYGNACVHKFSAAGELLHSWGSPGSAPGQFHVPHGIAVDQEQRVWVADRENSRLQIFSADGIFLHQWTDIARPCQIAIDARGNVLVAELGYRAGMWPGTSAPSEDATGGRISVFDANGELLSRWGGGNQPTAAGDFFAPHDLCVDSHGDLYVAEVMMSAGGNRGLVSPDCHTLQKFIRQPV